MTCAVRSRTALAGASKSQSLWNLTPCRDLTSRPTPPTTCPANSGLVTGANLNILILNNIPALLVILGFSCVMYFVPHSSRIGNRGMSRPAYLNESKLHSGFVRNHPGSLLRTSGPETRLARSFVRQIAGRAVRAPDWRGIENSVCFWLSASGRAPETPPDTVPVALADTQTLPTVRAGF
jgi:hypothetical protein